MLDSISQLRYPQVKHVPTAPSLELSHVYVQYDDTLALEDVSFQVKQGERIAIVGPNGAGKSTLFKVIVGILRPSKGKLSIFGEPPGGHICIGYVPQRRQIDWRFPVSVADVVMMGRAGRIGLFRWPRKHDWERVREALREVGMLEYAKRQIGELSGGQQQRVFLARALAQEAELLLLDEPLTGLDTPSQEAIFNILAKVQALGVTVLMATHDLDQAASRFDKMMLLNHRVIAFGPPAEAMTPENLIITYGGHVHQLPHSEVATKQPPIFLTDSCCSGGEER
ncbi:MAG: metal ABC transporter ATP-binding protein [Chloroflexi bacterium]|nr:metal ABC transporter ATP-binding protein [Chloroflexota bacterium]